MILYSDDAGPLSVRDALAEHLVREICSASPASVPLDRTTIRELAQGVAAYIERESGADPAWLDSDRVVALTCRALRALGHPELARRMALLGTRLVRAGDWLTAGGQPALELDLAQLLRQPRDSLELLFFRSLDCSLDGMADAWDASGGGGALILRNLHRSARTLLGNGPGNARSVESFGDEIRRRCAEKLQRLQSSRGWRGTPLVVHLETPARRRRKKRT